MGDHKLGHVGGRRVDGCGGRTGDPFKIDRCVLTIAVMIALGEVGHQRRRQGLARRAMGHRQRGENVIGEVLFKGFASDAFNNIAGQDRRIVGISKGCAWGIDAGRQRARQKVA